MKPRILSILLSLLIALLLIACETQNPVDSPIHSVQTPSTQSAIQVPDGATVTAAVLKLGCFQVPYSSTVGYPNYDVFNSTKSWLEASVTWNSFMPDGVGNKVASYVGAMGVISIPIPASLVQGWINGTIPNNGLVLMQRESLYDGGNYSKYNSSEGNPLQPTLVVTFSNGATGSSVAVQDCYINQRDPNSPCPEENYIAVGYLFTTQLWQKPGLVQFDFEITPPEEGGCSLTPGYWKTHSSDDGKKFDPTWNMILPSGDASPFFASGLSYIEMLDSATKGNPYFILAHAYIAAELNALNGADFTAAQSAFTAATALFVGANPDDIKKLKGDDKAEWIDLATILDNYNNGLIGPGHCD